MAKIKVKINRAAISKGLLKSKEVEKKMVKMYEQVNKTDNDGDVYTGKFRTVVGHPKSEKLTEADFKRFMKSGHPGQVKLAKAYFAQKGK